MNPVVLFRAEDVYDEELAVAKSILPTYTSRMELPTDSLVVARYSALPFYKELCNDLKVIGSELINSYDQHQYVAHISNWYRDFEDITPKTWGHGLEPITQIEGDHGFVVKGETNSRKHQWDTCMYAKNSFKVPLVMRALLDDTMISQQNLMVREFVQLQRYGTAINGLPITEEYRLFFLHGEFIAGGFYWSEHLDYIRENYHRDEWPDIEYIPADFIKDLGQRISDKVPFCVIDVGRKLDKTWTVIELNDGQMSGLSCTDARSLYTNLYTKLR